MLQQRPQSDGFDRNVVWDERQWESFLRAQDDCADEYLALLEYYGDDPDAHNLIARCMGWSHLLTNCSDQPTPPRCAACPQVEQIACNFHAAYFGDGGAPTGHWWTGWTQEDELADQVDRAEWDIRYAHHPIHQAVLGLVSRLCELCAHACRDEKTPLPDGPFKALLHETHRCVGKTAAALKGYFPPNRRGLAIAYLKSAFEASCIAMGRAGLCLRNREVSPVEADDLSARLLTIRSHLSDLIDDFRLELTDLLARPG